MPKISGLPTITAIADDDELAIRDVSTTTTKRISIAALRAFLQTIAGWITTAMIADLAATTSKIKPNYFMTQGTTGSSTRQSFSGNASTYVQITGSTYTYTSGPTKEVIELSGNFIAQASVTGSQGAIYADSTRIGRTTYDGDAAGQWYEHRPHALYEMEANTTVTFSLRLMSPGGTTTIANAINDPAAGYGMQLRGIAYGRS